MIYYLCNITIYYIHGNIVLLLLIYQFIYMYLNFIFEYMI